jgi:hypothetical protein
MRMFPRERGFAKLPFQALSICNPRGCRFDPHPLCSGASRSQLKLSGVAVEKGTKAVICVNFSACGKRRFNNLRANFVREIPREEFFNTHRRFHSLRIGLWSVSVIAGESPKVP